MTERTQYIIEFVLTPLEQHYAQPFGRKYFREYYPEGQRLDMTTHPLTAKCYATHEHADWARKQPPLDKHRTAVVIFNLNPTPIKTYPRESFLSPDGQ